MRSPYSIVALLITLLMISSNVAQAGTALCVDGKDGAVLGVNLDNDRRSPGLVFVNRRGVAKRSFRPATAQGNLEWVSRYGSVSFSMTGRGFASNGMNEAGLALTSLHLRASEPPEPDDRHPLDSASWVQYVLDNCATVEEVIAVDKRVRLLDLEKIPTHFFVADASGNCAVLAYLDGSFVYYSGESLPVRALTNMRYTKALEAHKRGGARWWWANPDRSAERFSNAAAQIQGFDKDGTTRALDHVFETLTQSVALPNTLWSIAYDTAARSVLFRSAMSPIAKRISFDLLDFSCDAPLKMMNVDVPLGGHVETFFAPYDHDKNLDLFLSFVSDFKLDVSTSQAEDLMGLFESFECNP
jgi:hypothetical protein